MDATIDQTELVDVKISRKSFEFLKALANEIDTQDARCTAKPYFFTLKKKQWRITDERYTTGSETKTVRVDSEHDYHEYLSLEEYIESFRDGGTTEEDMSDAEIEKRWDDLDEITMEEYEVDDNCFLTFKAYEEYVARNKHNIGPTGSYSSFLNHAYRNSEMDNLFKVIAEFKCNT